MPTPKPTFKAALALALWCAAISSPALAQTLPAPGSPPTSLLTPWAVVAAAATGAVGGFFSNAFLARRNLKKDISLKIAEYRLEWINNLGDQFAIFNACAIRLGFPQTSKDDDKALEVQQEMFRAATRIELLMNHKDPDYEGLLSTMHSIDKIVRKMRDGTDKYKAVSEMIKFDKEFITVANRILKREWSRTKEHLRKDTVEVSALESSKISNAPTGAGST